MKVKQYPSRYFENIQTDECSPPNILENCSVTENSYVGDSKTDELAKETEKTNSDFWNDEQHIISEMMNTKDNFCLCCY